MTEAAEQGGGAVDETAPEGGAIEQSREMEEHEREAQKRDDAERSPEAVDEDGRAATPTPPGNFGQLSGTP
jgi:hypothetical protein